MFKKLLLVLCCITTLLSFPSVGWSEKEESEPTIPHFFLDYLQVQCFYKNNEGRFDDLMTLYKNNPEAAIRIAKFWHQKAMKECLEVNNTVFKIHSDKMALATSPEGEAKIKKDAIDKAYRNIQGYYYDKWDEINKMIEDSIKAARLNGGG
ncbi:MAG: hypothetical protein PHY88_02635 [Candidatus Omnitrophica bacterium]|nr:hypothetical protein [Candidatus Omnitrophota bacterium]